MMKNLQMHQKYEQQKSDQMKRQVQRRINRERRLHSVIDEEEKSVQELDETSVSAREGSFNFMEQSFDIFAVQDQFIKRNPR